MAGPLSWRGNCVILNDQRRDMPRLILASGSPRRQKILRALGLQFEIAVPDVVEVDWPMAPTAMVLENATRKWQWCRTRYPGAAIVAADTTVELGGHCLGKPETRDKAFDMLKAESGRMQIVHTGFVLAHPDEPDVQATTETSTVFFRELSDDLIHRYLAVVNPLDRAGAYDIDHHGDWLIERIEGSWTNVMGLPAERVNEWITCRVVS